VKFNSIGEQKVSRAKLSLKFDGGEAAQLGWDLLLGDCSKIVFENRERSFE
jgi:hypothetical protein